MASPDIAVVTIGVISSAHTAQAALASNSSDIAAVIATIKAAGIEDKDIGNTGFNLNPIYPPERQPNPEQPAKIIGLSASPTTSASSFAILQKLVTFSTRWSAPAPTK